MRVNKKENRIIVKSVERNIKLRHVGRQGEPGVQGPAGLGLPEGGVDGDILVKDGDGEFEAKWVQPFSFDDKHFSADFIVSNYVAVNHGLNKYPAVSIMDSAGEEVVGEVDYLDTNHLIVKFTFPFSGRVICN